MLDIVELEFDDVNEAKLAAHRVSVREALQLLDDDFRVFRNKKQATANYLLIGKTHGGRLLTLPIVETAVDGRWRPISGWDASKAERTRYEQ
jgi:uncharacterized DUF497 family protein